MYLNSSVSATRTRTRTTTEVPYVRPLTCFIKKWSHFVCLTYKLYLPFASLSGLAILYQERVQVLPASLLYTFLMGSFQKHKKVIRSSLPTCLRRQSSCFRLDQKSCHLQTPDYYLSCTCLKLCCLNILVCQHQQLKTLVFIFFHILTVVFWNRARRNES